MNPSPLSISGQRPDGLGLAAGGLAHDCETLAPDHVLRQLEHLSVKYNISQHCKNWFKTHDSVKLQSMSVLQM